VIRPAVDSPDIEARVHLGRHVLRAVDRDIDPPIEEGPLDGRHEDAVAPCEVRRRPIPLGLDRDDAGGAAGSLDRRRDEPCLDEGERAPPGADRDR
jgi:hypothetical protein